MTALAMTALANRVRDGAWRATALAGVALVAGLGITLVDPGNRLLAVSVALSGIVVAALVLVPRAARIVRGHVAPTIVGTLGLLAVLWAVLRRTGVGNRFHSPDVLGLHIFSVFWGFGPAAFLPLAVMTLAVAGGLVLIADSLRSRIAATGAAAPAPWRRVTGTSGLPRGVPWRAVAGVLLIAWAGFLGLGVAGRYVANNRALEVLVLVLIAGGAAVVIGTPLLIASLARVDRDHAEHAREDERQRFAAHLHDSVLQTLALVQRQASDPAAVARLARRQEHALRAWMAGEAELSSETLSAALRGVVAEVEDEHEITVEISVIGERRLDSAGDALAAAAREALRNAARHAAGSAVFVFAELSPDAAEVFVRDEGPGFELADVPTERRGIRDAIVGRMAGVGGSATIDSAAGDGTEVALKIGAGR